MLRCNKKKKHLTDCARSTFGIGMYRCRFFLSCFFHYFAKSPCTALKLLPVAAGTKRWQEGVHSTEEVGQDIAWKGYTGSKEGRRSSVPEGTARICSYYLLWRSQVGKCNLIIPTKKGKKKNWIWSNLWLRVHPNRNQRRATGTHIGKVEQLQDCSASVYLWVSPGKCPNCVWMFVLSIAPGWVKLSSLSKSSSALLSVSNYGDI